MKNLLKTKPYFRTALLSSLLLFSACTKKEAGPGTGGSASIVGTVSGNDFNQGEYEIQQITFTSGAQLEHGDYFLLNKVKDGNNYYLYFKNPTWVTSADPGIQGRIGVAIDFNYSDSNLAIALAVKNALIALGNLNLNLVLDQDILTLSYKQREQIADPNNGTTPFSMDVVRQGKLDELIPTTLSMAEKRVYLCYGDSKYPNEETLTNQAGEYIFSDLRPGKYKVYVIGMTPPWELLHEEVAKNVEISDPESTIDAGNLHIYY